MLTMTVALGGNALMKAGEEATYANQSRNVMSASRVLADMVEKGYDLVITHGNGPQVGNIILQNELCADRVPPMPLDVCVAESQGQLGYMIKQSLTRALAERGLERTVVCILTSAIVDADDEAFDRPTKPIGPSYNEDEAAKLVRERGWAMGPDPRGGMRRLVPSPMPLGFVESRAIKRLVFGGEAQEEIVIASGGGGIPVVRSGDGYSGVEAVIDKDEAGSVLASEIGERLLVMLTDIDSIYTGFGTDSMEPIRNSDADDMEALARDGEFAEGSMLPKVDAAIRFLRRGGERVIITNPESLEGALRGSAGTNITP